MSTNTTPVDLPLLQQWQGRSETRHDHVAAGPVAAMAATLDRDEPEPRPGDALPPLWHWALFAPLARQSEIGPDGHPKRGGFLPPVPLPRRMWAGGRLEFHEPLRVGDAVTRESHILKVDGKSGRSGELVFVTVQHRYSTARGLALSEEHDIVYRDMPAPSSPGTPAPAPKLADTDESFARHVQPDPVLLFRYSALTFNGHRIHYDREYVTGVEGYPGLIVHGPLIATLLVDLLRHQEPRKRLRRFAFTAVRPVFDIHGFTLCGRMPQADKAQLWTRDHEGFLTMQAQAELA